MAALLGTRMTKQLKQRIGAVIVTWNSAAEIGSCLEAAHKAGVTEIVVVDNGSSDETIEIVKEYAGVQLLSFPENLGFAGGVNQGVATLTCDFALILNPDCRVESGLNDMAVAAELGAAGGKLLAADGTMQTGFAVRRLPSAIILIFETLGLNRLFPGNPVNRRYRCLDFDPDLPQEIEQPPAAFFLVRRDLFQQLGGMDEAFWPVWFEDVDFCARFAKAGYRIYYCPSAIAWHGGAASIDKILWSSRELAWYGSLLRYATKHFGWLSRCLVGLAVAAASVPKALMGIIYRRQGVRALGVFTRVLRLVWMSLVLGRVDNRRFRRQLEGPDQL